MDTEQLPLTNGHARGLTPEEMSEPGLKARHHELEQQYERGLSDSCMALHLILNEETYHAEGWVNFSTYLASRGINKSVGYLMASAGPMFVVSAIRGKVTAIEQFKPIAKMRDPGEQAKCIEIAAKVAERDEVPLTGKIVAEVARKNFGWKSQAELRALKKAKARVANPELKFAGLRESLQDAFAVILDYELTGPEIVGKVGDPKLLIGFTQVRDILNDMLEAAP